METIPTNAAFIIEINDNEDFIRKSNDLLPYLDELFVMDALPAFETIYDYLPNEQYSITISGHGDNAGIFLLFNVGMDMHVFKKLLKALNIDPQNYTPFEEYKIYTYGTNYKSLKIAYYNHILSISENLDLLKKGLILHKHPKNLLSDKSFKRIYHIIEKNKKQNWLILQNDSYLDYISSYADRHLQDKINYLKEKSTWSAYQVRFSGMDLFLSGYATTEAVEFKKLAGQVPQCDVPAHILPAATEWYYKVGMPDRTLWTDNIKQQPATPRCTPEALAQFNLIAPKTACYFDLTTDSSKHYHYIAILTDTALSCIDTIIGHPQPDSDIPTQYTEGIYPVPADGFNKIISYFDRGQYPYCTEKNGYHIFADTPEAIRFYRKSITLHGTLSDNRYYKFTKDNIASKNLLEYTYFNEYRRKPLMMLMSAKGKMSNVARDLMIFSISCSELIDNYAAISLYFHFGTRDLPTLMPTPVETDTTANEIL